MREELYLKNKIRNIRMKCHEIGCRIKCKVIEVSDPYRYNSMKLHFMCWKHGEFTKVKSIKSIMK